MWEHSKIYSASFISELKAITQERKKELQKKEKELDWEIVKLIESAKQAGALVTVLMNMEKNEIKDKRENVWLTLQRMQAMNQTERAFELTALQQTLMELRRGMDYQASTMEEVGGILKELGDKAKYVEGSMDRTKRQKW